MNELYEEGALRRALRLDPDERPRIDVAAFVRMAEAADQQRTARVVLAVTAALGALPVVAVVQLLATILSEPSLASDPAGILALALIPVAQGLSLLTQPGPAVAALSAVAILFLFERKERHHVSHAA
ncbi:MAG: hypothetical protein HY071_03245 [Chloroflexi bacterium]|nr:hypothetical protein [Chloroflexota bacterium]